MERDLSADRSGYPDLIRGMQQAAFAGDWQTFQTFFTPHTRYRVGNVVDLVGAPSIARFLQDLFTSTFEFTGMTPRATRVAEDTVIVEYDMAGRRLADRSPVQYPCVDIYALGAGKFQDWRVYPIERQFVVSPSRVPAEPKRDKTRTAAALPQVIQQFQQMLAKGDFERAQLLLAPDVVLRVADHPEVTGPAALVKQLGEVFSKRLQPTAAEFVNVWTFPDALAVELTVDAVRVGDGQAVTYRCAETYRITGGQIREYRIYPLESDLLAVR